MGFRFFLVFSILVTRVTAVWKLGKPPPAYHVHEWRIDLIQPTDGLQWLEEVFWNVSTPRSTSYGKHVSLAKIRSHLSPPIQDVRQILSWLDESNLHYTVSSTGDFVFVKSMIRATESAFQVFEKEWKLYVHTNSLSQVAVIRSLKRAPIPQHLSHVIKKFSLLDSLPPVAARHFSHKRTGDPGISVTPEVIAASIGLPGTQSFTDLETSQAVAEFEQGYFYPSDLIAFEKKYSLPVGNLTKIVGKNDPTSGYLGEATLDVEFIQVYVLWTLYFIT